MAFTNLSLFIMVLGLQSPSNRNTFNYWVSSENEHLWRREQGYINTQGHRGIVWLLVFLFLAPILFLLRVCLDEG